MLEKCGILLCLLYLAQLVQPAAHGHGQHTVSNLLLNIYVINPYVTYFLIWFDFNMYWWIKFDKNDLQPSVIGNKYKHLIE